MVPCTQSLKSMSLSIDNLVEIEQASDVDDIYAWDEYTVSALVELITQEAGGNAQKLEKYAKYVSDWIDDENDDRVIAARSLVPVNE